MLGRPAIKFLSCLGFGHFWKPLSFGSLSSKPALTIHKLFSNAGSPCYKVHVLSERFVEIALAFAYFKGIDHDILFDHKSLFMHVIASSVHSLWASAFAPALARLRELSCE
jgi:hypothetical protein